MLDIIEPMSIVVEDYYWTMAARHRLILGRSNGQIGFLCTFFLLREAKQVFRYYCKPPYAVVDDDPDGTMVYVDHIVSYIPFTKEVVRKVEHELVTRHPQLEQAIWYRARHGDLPDRRYTLRRRCFNGAAT